MKYIIILIFCHYSFAFNKIQKIERSIYLLEKEQKMKLHPAYRKKLAYTINDVSKTFKVNYKIIVSILYIESHFKQFAVSSTKDYSIAQISLHQWVKNKKLKKTKHLLKDIKKDPFKSLYVMGEILSIKREESISDPEWYLHYHSKTKEFKTIYRIKFNKAYKKIKDV